MFSACFPGVLRVCQVRQILGVFEVFLDIVKQKNQGKAGQGSDLTANLHDKSIFGARSKSFPHRKARGREHRVLENMLVG